MKIRVVALGHRMPKWVDAGWDDYARRIPREFPLELVELKSEPRRSGSTTSRLLAAEATRIDGACKDARPIVLDERGTAWSTREFAAALQRWRDEGPDIAFVIGSADGLADAVRQRAHAVVALSALTLPHGLVRVVVAEQLYRATSLLAGHPYHRE
jgi:23S rRNA (pseudouridine1915-N3)-methyltransferase